MLTLPLLMLDFLLSVVFLLPLKDDRGRHRSFPFMTVGLMVLNTLIHGLAHYALPRWNLFRLFKRHGRYAEAREQLEQIIAATPDDFRAYGEMGFLLRNHLDDPGTAVHFWHESLRLKPDQPQILTALTENHLQN